MRTKLRLLKCYVGSTLLYGCEGWTISNIMRTRLEATELWSLRRMMLYYLSRYTEKPLEGDQDKLDFRSCARKE